MPVLNGGGAPTGQDVTPFAFGGDAHEHDDDCEHGDERVQALVDLPAPVRGRVAALRKLQIDTIKHEADFYKAVHKLEKEFATRFTKLNVERANIVNGKSEPSIEDTTFPLFSETDAELAETFTKALEVAQPNSAENEIKGVPDFWIQVLGNVECTADTIAEGDEAILKKLTDINVELTGDGETMGFSIDFHFDENEYFTNTVLNKTYTMKCSPDMKDPADFDGPEIIKSVGCTIEWKEGKNVTVKLVKKKQKNKKKEGQVRFVTKQEQTASFFNLFSPPAHTGTEGDVEMDDKDREALHRDFEIGQTIRDTVVPHALFHFTGEADTGDDFDDFDSEDMSDEEDDEE